MWVSGVWYRLSVGGEGRYTDRSSRVWSPPPFSWPERRLTTTYTLLLLRETSLSRRSSSSRSLTCGASPTAEQRDDSGETMSGRTLQPHTTPVADLTFGGSSQSPGLPCVKVWALSPWRSQTCRVRSSACPRIWSTDWDTPGGRSSGSPYSDKALSAGTRCPPHSGRS